MTPKNWGDGRQRLTVCAGSNRPPLSQEARVGICPVCGVRTFLDHAMSRPTVHPHSSTRLEVAAFEHARRLA